MLNCRIKYRDGTTQTCAMTKKQAKQEINNHDIVQITVYKNGKICADYIKEIHY